MDLDEFLALLRDRAVTDLLDDERVRVQTNAALVPRQSPFLRLGDAVVEVSVASPLTDALRVAYVVLTTAFVH